MSYLKIEKDNVSKEYILTNAFNKPYMHISGSLLPLTTNTTQGLHLNIEANNTTYRPLEYGSASASDTYYTSMVNSEGLSSTTALTRSSTSGESYETRASTSGTSYLTARVTNNTTLKSTYFYSGFSLYTGQNNTTSSQYAYGSCIGDCTRYISSNSTTQKVYIPSLTTVTNYNFMASITFKTTYASSYNSNMSGSRTSTLSSNNAKISSVLGKSRTSSYFDGIISSYTTCSDQCINDNSIYYYNYTSKTLISKTSYAGAYIYTNVEGSLIISSIYFDQRAYIDKTTGTSYLTRSSTSKTVYLTCSSTSAYSGVSSSSSESSGWN